jgi:hypothetical protein
LQTWIKWMENYYRGANINDLKALKQELAYLPKEDPKADKLRSLPLYSYRITDWKFVCSNVMTRSTHVCYCKTKALT